MKFQMHTPRDAEQVRLWLQEQIDGQRRMPHKMQLAYYGRVEQDSFWCRLRHGDSLMMRVVHRGTVRQGAQGSQVEVVSRFGLLSLLYFLFFLLVTGSLFLFMAFSSIAYPSPMGARDIFMDAGILLLLLMPPYFFWLHFWLKGRSDMRRLHCELRKGLKGSVNP